VTLRARTPIPSVALAVSLGLGLAGCGGSGGSSGGGSSSASLASAVLKSTMSGTTQVFDLHASAQNQFSAATLEAKPGTVRIVLHVDAGSAPHNVTFDALGSAATPTVDAGSTGEVTITVPQPGVYPFACTIHPGMRAALHIS